MGETLKDIARIADVSVSTVSRCLNDSPLVSEKTKKRVKAIADELNFKFNVNARNLVKQETKKIGIIFPNDYYKFNRGAFYGRLQESLLERTEEFGYEPIIYPLTYKENGKRNLINLISNKEVDGIIIACRDISSEELNALKNSKIPYVFLYFRPKGYRSNKKIFSIDNVYSGYLATKYLIENGCKNIITLSNIDKDLKDYQARTKGFVKAMEEAGLNGNKKIFKGETTFEYAKVLVGEKIEMFDGVDGIFCQQDKLALGLIEEFKKIGISVPDDISIIGHDDMEICNYFTPRLTTVRQPLEDVCMKSLDYLIAEIKGEKLELESVFYSKIIENETT